MMALPPITSPTFERTAVVEVADDPGPWRAARETSKTRRSILKTVTEASSRTVTEMSVDGSFLSSSSRANQATVGGLSSVDERVEVEHSYHEDVMNGKKFQVTGIPRLDLKRWLTNAPF